MSIEDAIPKMVKDLNLEQELKNKIFEIYDNILKEDAASAREKFRLKDCINTNILPGYFTNPH